MRFMWTLFVVDGYEHDSTATMLYGCHGVSEMDTAFPESPTEEVARMQ